MMVQDETPLYEGNATRSVRNLMLQLLRKQQVAGSSPAVGSIQRLVKTGHFSFFAAVKVWTGTEVARGLDRCQSRFRSFLQIEDPTTSSAVEYFTVVRWRGSI
jgi:hypothetical protein